VQNTAALDKNLAELGTRINKCDLFLADARQRLGTAELRQLQVVIYRVLFFNAVEVDVNGKFELSIAVLFDAVGLCVARPDWVLECLVKVEDDLLDNQVQFLLV
jgi:hypothetical protein